MPGYDIPKGHSVIAGRGREIAQKALAAADAAGVDQYNVRTVPDGYLVPDAVAAAYNEAAGIEATETPEATPAAEVAAEAAPTGDESTAENKVGDEGNPVVPETEVTAAEEVDYPKGNDSKDTWLTFAEKRPGFTEADRELSYADIKAKFGPQK